MTASGRPVVVVGDALLDVDVEGSADRLCPDAPAPVLAVTGERERPGGAALAAALVAGRGVPVDLVTALPDDEPAARLRALLDGAVRLVAGPAAGATVVKCRMRASGRSLLRTDRGDARPTADFGGAVADALEAALAGAGAVLVADYGRGVPADPAVRAALERAVARRVPVVWDPHPRGAPPIAGAVVTPNAAEAAAAAGAPTGTVPEALAAARTLTGRWDARAVVVTLGAAGAVVGQRHGACSAAPAPEVPETDPCGAGDCFSGAVAARLAAGATVDEAVAGAVEDAAGYVARGGGATVRRAGDRWGQPVAAAAARPGVVGDAAVHALVRRVRAGGGTVVATGGRFDPLHSGHAGSLAAARALGDCLVVLVNSDASIRRAGGPAPRLPEADRLARVAALHGVDGVAVLDADDPRPLLRALRPDLWVKGADHDPSALPETPLVRSWGGEVVVVPYRASAVALPEQPAELGEVRGARSAGRGSGAAR